MIFDMFRTAVLITMLLAAGCLWRVRSEYKTRETLSLPTATAVWMLYSFHLLLSMYAACFSLWPLAMGPVWLSYTIGMMLLVTGLGMIIAGIIEFGSMQRISGRRIDQLITTGIYRWSRNPQNVGWVVVLVGTALLGRSGVGFLLAALFWLGFLIYLPAEERCLERVFGETYRRYRDCIPRFFGPPDPEFDNS